MIYTAWAPKENEPPTTLVEGDGPLSYSDGSVCAECVAKIWTIEANSWEEACLEYHKRMGWEPYKSLLED